MEHKSRLPALDSMRAIAALGVVCWHYRGYFRAFPFKVILAPFYKNGLPMVDFFFVLSGFVLARAYWVDARRFAIGANIGQRIARLYPLHLVTLLVILVIQLAASNIVVPFDPFKFNDAYNFCANLLLLQSSGLQRGLFSFNQPSWSISTEFIVNTVFLCAIALPRRLSLAAVFALAALCVSAFAHRSLYDIGYAWRPVSILVARTGAGFFIGALTYRVFDRYRDTLGRLGSTTGNATFALLVLGMYGYFRRHQLNGTGVDLMVSLVGFPALIVAVSMSPWASRILCVRPLTWLGERSYSIYMTHYALILCLQIAQIVLGIDIRFGNDAVFLAFLTLLAAISAIAYRYIELPGKRLLTTKRMAAPIAKDEAVKVAG